MPIDWFGTGGTADQWAYMDANARQGIVNSGQIYTIGGIKYQSGKQVGVGGTSALNPGKNLVEGEWLLNTFNPDLPLAYVTNVPGINKMSDYYGVQDLGEAGSVHIPLTKEQYDSYIAGGMTYWDRALKSLVTPGEVINSYQKGGFIERTGLAYLHEGEQIIPANKSSSEGTTINLYNPTFQVSGKDDRQLFESFMRIMKQEGMRVR